MLLGKNCLAPLNKRYFQESPVIRIWEKEDFGEAEEEELEVTYKESVEVATVTRVMWSMCQVPQLPVCSFHKLRMEIRFQICPLMKDC